MLSNEQVQAAKVLVDELIRNRQLAIVDFDSATNIKSMHVARIACGVTGALGSGPMRKVLIVGVVEDEEVQPNEQEKAR